MLRRIAALIIAGTVAAGLIGVMAVPGGAQTTTTAGAGNLATFCNARIALNQADGKKATLAGIDAMLTSVPAPIAQPLQELRTIYAKKGDRVFDDESGLQLLTTLDTYVYENCPGTKVPVTAIDYEFQGVPPTLAAGTAQFKLTNNAPKEEHEMIVVKLTPEGEGQDLEKLLGLPEKKVGKFVDFSTATFMFAPAGQSGFSPASLETGTYVYACFVPVGGNKKGAPHFTEGMYGTFTVS